MGKAKQNDIISQERKSNIPISLKAAKQFPEFSYAAYLFPAFDA